MTYRELKEKLNSIDESLLDNGINAFDNFTGDWYQIACAHKYDDLPKTFRDDWEEEAGLVFIQIPDKSNDNTDSKKFRIKIDDLQSLEIMENEIDTLMTGLSSIDANSDEFIQNVNSLFSSFMKECNQLPKK